MFDLERKAPSTEQRPEWLTNNNEVRVYDAILDRVREIKELISESRASLKPSDYKIAKSVICKELGLSPGYVSKHSKLLEFADGQQRIVKRLASDVQKKAKSRSYAKKSPEEMCKKDLVKEVKALRKLLTERESELYAEQLISLLDAGFGETQVLTKNRTRQLEQDLKAAHKSIIRYEEIISELNEALADSERLRRGKVSYISSIR